MCDWTDGVRPAGQGMVKGEMKLKIFISSVLKEFAGERRLLADYIRRDPLLGSFFSVFLFEESPAIDVPDRKSVV